LAAWSGLGGAGGVRPGCGGADLGRGVLSVVQIRCFNNTLVFEFFCFEMMCQYIIGGQKTLDFCHNLIEGALLDRYFISKLSTASMTFTLVLALAKLI